MTKKLATAAVLAALTTVFLCASVFLPTGRLTCLILSSFCILAAQVECGTRYSLLSYAVATLICVLFLSFKAQILAFFAFLGYYPIVKCYVEQLKNVKLEWIVKILFFSTVLVLLYFLAQYLLMPNMELGVIMNYIFSHIPLIVIVAEIIFIIYDLLLTMLATYYIRMIQPRMQKP